MGLWSRGQPIGRNLWSKANELVVADDFAYTILNDSKKLTIHPEDWQAHLKDVKIRNRNDQKALTDSEVDEMKLTGST